MRSKPTTEELDALVQRVMASLPDSLRARKAELVTLLWLLPRDYRGRDDIGKTLHSPRIHEQAQARFQFSQGGEK